MFILKKCFEVTVCNISAILVWKEKGIQQSLQKIFLYLKWTHTNQQDGKYDQQQSNFVIKYNIIQQKDIINTPAAIRVLKIK